MITDDVEIGVSRLSCSNPETSEMAKFFGGRRRTVPPPSPSSHGGEGVPLGRVRRKNTIHYEGQREVNDWRDFQMTPGK